MTEAPSGANTSNRTLKKYLGQARRALAGTKPQSSDGALPLVRREMNWAAVPFVMQAIDWLEEAHAGGSDVGVLIKIAEHLGVALSAA